MRTEQEIREKIIEELNSLETEMLSGIIKVEKTQNESEMGGHFRTASDINERIMTLRWVLGEVGEL